MSPTRISYRATHRIVLFTALAFAAGCGGGSATSRIGPQTAGHAAKLDRVNPKAARAFDNAMRALRLGGPEANDTASFDHLIGSREQRPRKREAEHTGRLEVDGQPGARGQLEGNLRGADPRKTLSS